MVQKNPSIFGLIGFPVKHSFSPAMHNAAFEKLGIDADYRLFEVRPQDLEDFLLKPDREFPDKNDNIVRAGDVICFNITIPHKIRALQILSKQCPLGWKPLDSYFSTLSGAINTVKRTENGIECLNTDAIGFIKSLQEDLNFYHKDKTILLIGCGGAARAIISGLCWPIGDSVLKIYATDISVEAIKATEEHFLSVNKPSISEKLEFIPIGKVKNIIGKCDLLINATPIGMKNGDNLLVEKNLLHENLYIYDIVYNRKTKLLETAQSLGLKATGGLGMLLYQGSSAFTFWTGKQAPIEIMRKALMSEISKKGGV